MRAFAVRRLWSLAICMFLAAALVSVHSLSALTLHRGPALSGWVLLGLILALASYNVRKRFPFLPLGSASGWLQLHIYTGLLSYVIFVLHIGWRIPNGIFETVLGGLYTLVFLSGVAGLWMSRRFAQRITTRGPEIIYERIPRARRMIQLQVEQQVVACLTETESTAIPEFYSQRLRRFFDGPSHFWSHLFQSSRGVRRLLELINAQRRYLNPAECEVTDQICDAVRAKDDLDYQYAHQAVLKYWLFAHVPLTYGLLVFSLFHVMLVQAFSGGIR